MHKKELLETLLSERESWDDLLARVARYSGLTEPGLAGEWTGKDTIAHITWYELVTAIMLERRSFEDSELWELPQDERNIPIYELSKDRELKDVLAESKLAFERLFQAIEVFTNEELQDAGCFRGMPDEWKPWKVIASNSYEHYRQHIPAIQAWLDQFGNSP